jgi:hypothetical protein
MRIHICTEWDTQYKCPHLYRVVTSHRHICTEWDTQYKCPHLYRVVTSHSTYVSYVVTLIWPSFHALCFLFSFLFISTSHLSHQQITTIFTRFISQESPHESRSQIHNITTKITSTITHSSQNQHKNHHKFTKSPDRADLPAPACHRTSWPPRSPGSAPRAGLCPPACAAPIETLLVPCRDIEKDVREENEERDEN